MKSMNKRRLYAMLTVLLLLTAAVGGTVAFLIDSTDPLVNTFTPAEVTVYITDNVANNVKSNVVITNTGTTDAYIRARIVGNWVDDETGYIVQAWNPAGDGEFSGLSGDGWILNGDYYYYTIPVEPDTETETALFTSYEVKNTVEGAHLEMDILVQAVQATSAAATDAWGLDPSGLK